MHQPTLNRCAPAPGAAVVFDCDGLLVNTQTAWDDAYTALFARYGVPLAPADRRSFVGLELAPLGQRLADLLDHPASPHELGRQAYELMREHLGSRLAPMPGAVELVDALAGTRPLAVASNAPTTVVIAHLSDFFDLTAFTAIVGSDLAGIPKPAPNAYRVACAAMNVEPGDAIAMEDSSPGGAAALAAGLYLVGVPYSPEVIFPCHLRVPALTDSRLWQALAVDPSLVSGSPSRHV
ncbi:HAD family phosphatase [Microbispora sp. NBRC 16548]|uniref:HAD family hydrolase n=1 Tax=Microbispora sp. NBRC 16548 TaxID=3030994 RepID=UPI0024A4DB7F|nr:HAD family phosphatase [Microbispora sp. NBRC 16548]GLX06591.1 haloacid dehalogenase [Microbispora sp. NBRC 16548]